MTYKTAWRMLHQIRGILTGSAEEQPFPQHLRQATAATAPAPSTEVIADDEPARSPHRQRYQPGVRMFAAALAYQSSDVVQRAIPEETPPPAAVAPSPAPPAEATDETAGLWSTLKRGVRRYALPGSGLSSSLGGQSSDQPGEDEPAEDRRTR